MTQPRPGSIRFVATCALLLATFCFVACQQSQSPQTTEMKASSAAAPAEKVSIVFEGPWAFAQDPQDPNKIVFIAPKTKSHHDLYASASNDATLPAGNYELSVPVSGAPGTPTFAADFAEADISAADLQHILDTKSERYVVRLPKPEAFLAAGRFRSRVGPKYPPDAEKDYVTEVALRYSVSSFNGFSLAGTPHSGTFNPKLMQIEAGTAKFSITPVEAFNPTETCHVHARQAFRDLTQLVKVTLYIDFPDSPDKCRGNDPQKSKAAAKFGSPFSVADLLALMEDSDLKVRKAGLLPEIGSTYMLFTRNPLVCTGAIIKLKTTS